MQPSACARALRLRIGSKAMLSHAPQGQPCVAARGEEVTKVVSVGMLSLRGAYAES